MSPIFDQNFSYFLVNYRNQFFEFLKCIKIYKIVNTCNKIHYYFTDPPIITSIQISSMLNNSIIFLLFQWQLS